MSFHEGRLEEGDPAGRPLSASRSLRRPRAVLFAAGVLLVGLATAALPWARAALQAMEDLHPRRVAVDRSESQRMDLREVRFPAQDGVVLRGWYQPPANGAVVLLTHGHGATRQQMLGHAALLLRHGFGVLLFDLRAHGESDGDLATSGDQERRDVEGAMAFIQAQPDARDASIGAIGFSAGGIALAEVAARDRRIGAVVLEATAPTLEENLRADYPRNWFLQRSVGILVHRLGGVRVDDVRPIDRLCSISPRPLLLIYGSDDPGFPAATGKRMFDASCEPRSLWIVPGGLHGGFLELWPEEFERRVVPFLRDALSMRPRGAGPE